MLFQNSKKVIFVLTSFLGLAIVMFALGCERKPEHFSDDNVVAQFVNGVITTDQLTAYISKIGPKCHTPAMSCHAGEVSGCGSDKSCDMHDNQGAQMQNVSIEGTGSDCCGGQHGGDHAGCCGGSETALKSQTCQEHENCCMQHYDLKVEDYQNLIKAMVLEHMMQEYIRENKIGQEEDTRNLIKYVAENVYITDTHLDMEESMKPTESEIRRYYEENKKQFGLRTLNEVRDEITKILKNRMHSEYMPKYLAELKRNAFIKKNLELLKPQEPTEYELQSFYREHRSEYVDPESIKVRQIVTDSRQKAEQAQSRLRSGMSFTTVAELYSEGAFAASGGHVPYQIKKGDRSRIYEENVFKLREGDTSILFEDNGSFYIVKVIEKYDKRVKSFEEVADFIRETVLIEKEKKLFEDNAKRTLFTVNNRSYSMEEFKRNYDTLPSRMHTRFSGLSGKENLIDRMIEYELLVDDARHKMFDLKNKETVQDITDAILQGTLYEKEVIGKIGIKDISDEEAEKYYNENKERFVSPPRAKISFIRIPISHTQGSDKNPAESEIKTAKQLAEEAYAMIENGAEFDAVARRYSADEWSSRKLEMYEEKDTPLADPTEVRVHPLHEVVFSLKEGEISKPFRFQDNYFILKLWEKSERNYIAFDVLKEAIKQVLVIQKRKELAETLKDELMEKSELVINERTLKVMAKKRAEKKSRSEEANMGHSG